MSEQTGLQTAGPTILARPDWLKAGDKRGADHITRADLLIPRIGLAQGLSPEISELDAKYIPGLKVGDMFDSVRRTSLGKGPLDVTVVRGDVPRYVEFYPLESGGGIKDFNVPSNDPRTLFGPDGRKPLATKFFNMLILTLPVDPESPMSSLVVVSFKGSGLKVAMQWNTYINERNAPAFAGRYKLSSVMTKNSKGTFAVFKVENNGFVDEATFHVAEQVFKMTEGRKLAAEAVDTEREPGSDDL